ncbi:hypothetical protein C0J52_20347, partial [Blattella germanica]
YLTTNVCQHNRFICCFDKIFHIPLLRKSFIFGESITIPQHLLDHTVYVLRNVIYNPCQIHLYKMFN